MENKTDKTLNQSNKSLDLDDYPTNTSFFGHPKQIITLLGVETWERFSYYGLQGIVLLYMYYQISDGGLGISQAAAASVVGAYSGGLYLASIFVSWVADRLLGREKTLFFTASLVMLGHIILAFINDVSGFAIGIFLIAFGGGGVKVSSTSIVSSFYKKNDPRLGSGFALYYLGINLGGFIGPLLTGWLQSTKGFQYGFGVAAIGMAIGLFQYALGRKYLPKSTKLVAHPLKSHEKKKFYLLVISIVIFAIITLYSKIVNINNASIVMILLSVFATIVLYSIMLNSSKVSKIEKDRVKASIPLFVSQVVFWALYQQQFTVLTVYSDKRLNRNIGDWEIPVAWIQSINPIFIILLSSFFAGLWANWKNQPTTTAKFAWANVGIGFAYFLFLPFANSGQNKTPLLIITAILFIFTIGEMFISPVGLAISTQLAPKAFTTQMVALFFLASGIGTSLAGTLAKYYNPANEIPYFMFLGIGSIATGFIMFAFSKWVKEKTHGLS